jgi:phosphate transport system substrate-binding protein
MLLNFKPMRQTVSATVIALTFGLVACQSQTPQAGTSPAPDGSPAAPAIVDGKVSLSGAGASFPAPLYQRWFADFNKKYPNIQVSYQSVGSGAGVQQFTAGTVDFGASDVAMKDEEIQKVAKGAIMLPMTAGSIVLAYNLPQVETPLKLSRDTYVGILLGEIKNWNDPKIAKDNPDAKLPDETIKVIYRADGSGTTGVFTLHLSAISPTWKQKVGDGKTVNWPTGTGAKGNEGITAQIQQTQGSIGYVEYGYAKQNGLKSATLQNKAGTFVEPTDASASATLASVQLPENLRAFIEDPEGNDSYPIVTYTWLLVYKQYDDPNKAKAIKAMIDYGLTEGQQVSPQLGYVQLPDTVVSKVKSAADTIPAQ